ncbi:MAG TPA: efflux RND transporter periplasmic adaptor subunit [Thermoanaerobaculia bacterium]|nr:efflux RND transporter periplasmic adaptor subunit [Thermoanaerobaculia bacterium]
MKTSRLLLTLAVCASFAGCDEQPDAVAAGTPSVEVRGTVASAQTANAIAGIDGRVARVAVTEGARVRQGDLVATLTNSSIDRDLAFARAQVASIQQRLRDARKPIATSLILGDAGARERAAAEILATREARRDRYRELYKTHDITKQELEDAEAAYAAALRDWLGERERASMKVVQTDTSVLELELQKAKAEEALAAERKSLLEVRAPLSGVVTRVAAHPGETIFARDAVVEIANTATVDVHAQIAPELMRYVRPGMHVDVKVLTVPPRRFTVPVRSVVPGTGGAIVVVQLPNPDGVLHQGQNAVVTVK